MEVWEQDGYACIANDGLPEHVCYINPERGSGQGDVSSPQTWVAFFDIILRTLELENEVFFEHLSKDGTPNADAEWAPAKGQYSMHVCHRPRPKDRPG